ncbi:MAG: DNA modification methylase [Marine Group III euryarchaeote CG-Bathy1]|uniref:site-specific DNA-methyltransferase (cytosine-N(4)-specific) n=1 Tax=Marine Group III euryarchaeote CG-Bathy1 TaxID=1889001 RepID=A0A1J5T8B8_9ARCH|nr:MAG: DNA modification methylase [Marine Group III euryarchaeote CG-Bathy1]
MPAVSIEKAKAVISDFVLVDQGTSIDELTLGSEKYVKFVNEFWTAKQRQANSIHEISYRACYKPQLPRFFIDIFTKEGDVVYDPFAGRGTTLIEAALLHRNIVSNDVNPLSRLLVEPRLNIPTIDEIERRLDSINIGQSKTDIDLSMFFHKDTEAEIVSLKGQLTDSFIDNWIRMVATNRLTGHSAGFFSGYTLPPNQAASQKSQKVINERLGIVPPYKNTKEIILKKSKSLQRNLNSKIMEQLEAIGQNAIFSDKDSRDTDHIQDSSINLTVTSPPFLNIVRYADDNWLRCWFNDIEVSEVEKKISLCRNVATWSDMMESVFDELHRVTVPGGWVAFEVGEVNNGKVKLDEYVVPLGIESGFTCAGVMVNSQDFTKTSNIWGVDNMKTGTNTNRIVLFNKSK